MQLFTIVSSVPTITILPSQHNKQSSPSSKIQKRSGQWSDVIWEFGAEHFFFLRLLPLKTQYAN